MLPLMTRPLIKPTCNWGHQRQKQRRKDQPHRQRQCLARNGQQQDRRGHHQIDHHAHPRHLYRTHTKDAASRRRLLSADQRRRQGPGTALPRPNPKGQEMAVVRANTSRPAPPTSPMHRARTIAGPSKGCHRVPSRAPVNRPSLPMLSPMTNSSHSTAPLISWVSPDQRPAKPPLKSTGPAAPKTA